MAFHVALEWRPRVAASDVLMFLCRVLAGGTFRAKSVAKRTCIGLLWEFVRVLSGLFDKYIGVIYAPKHRDTFDAAPPVLRLVPSDSDTSPVKIRPCLIDPMAAWSVLQRARAVHAVSARTVLLAKNDEKNLIGLAGSNADTWLHADVIPYQDKHRVLTGGLRFYNMTADPSVYGGIDTLIGVLWVYERKVADPEPWRDGEG